MTCHKDSMEDIACIHHNKDKYIYLIIPCFNHILFYYILYYHFIYFKIKLIKLIWLGFVISPSTSMDPDVACLLFQTQWSTQNGTSFVI